MTDDIIRQGDAAPPTPQGIETQPPERDQRARRWRTIMVTACAGLAVLAITVAISLLGARPGQGPSTEAGAPVVTSTPALSPSPTTATAGLGTFLTARVDRAGTRVTVFVSSPGPCQAWAAAGSTVDEQADQVVITVSGAPETVDCARAIDTPVEFTLSQPLGDRMIMDGRRQNAPVLVVRDAGLPVIPDRWWEVPTSYFSLDGNSFFIAYTTPGGPDLHFRIMRGQISEPVLEQVMIGGYEAVIVNVNGSEEVQWAVGDLVYAMTLMPTEGATTSREQLHSVLAQLT